MCKNRVYLSKIDLLLRQDIYDDLLQIISSENRERCRRFRLKEDALRTLYGELILRHVLTQRFSLRNEGIEILKGDKGKPYVKDFPTHFNISHAGDFVICAFSEKEVGIDVEQVKEVDLNIAKRYFHPFECEDLFAQDASRQLEYFFLLWTLKESYMKWLGDGMSIPLDSFFFRVADDNISLTDKHREARPFFKQFTIGGYQVSLCSAVDDFPDRIEEISIDEMRFNKRDLENE